MVGCSLIAVQLDLCLAIGIERPRPYKRRRVDSSSSSTDASASTSLTAIDKSLRYIEELRPIMKIPESDQESESALSVSFDSAPRAGPSSHGLDSLSPSNGHTNGSGFTLPTTNGTANAMSNGIQKLKSITKVSPPGTSLYVDDSYLDREEFVRLVLQSLRDVGYMCVP